MATVYLAIQESVQREVALKVMSSALAEDKAFSERFFREARIVSQLNHPNIVTVYDVGMHEGHHYLSMQYVPGSDLKQSMAELSGAQILRMMREVASALDYSGRKGYVHRDVKPENIMLHADDGRALLMDFGIARAADCDNNMTRTGVALGTPYYMSPEQARGKPVDTRSDLYALGVVFYLVLTGKVPYDAESAIAIGIKHIAEPIPPLPEALADFQPLMAKLLAKKPADRFQSGNELIAALAELDPAAIDRWRIIRDHNVAPATMLSEPTPQRPERRQRVAMTTPSVHIPAEDIRERQREEPRTGRGYRRAGLLMILLLTLAGAYLSQFGGRWPPADGELQQLLDRAGIAPWLDSMLAGGASGQVAATDPAAVSSPEGPIETTASELLRLRNEARVQAARVQVDPSALPVLLDLYRDMLALDPELTEASTALADIASQQGAEVSAAIAEQRWNNAGTALNKLIELFPEQADSAEVNEWRQRIDQGRTVTDSLARAKTLLQADKLTLPAEDNALLRYQQVLSLAPDNAEAIRGVAAIAERYRQLAESALQREDWSRAAALIANGEQVQPLPAFAGLRARLQQQQAVERLLVQAEAAVARGDDFRGEPSALELYQSVLAITPDEATARKGVEDLLSARVSRVRQALANYQFEQAFTLLQPALRALPENRQLSALSSEIEATRPRIDNLLISGGAEGGVLDSGARPISADRTLYVAFEYHNFFTPTTVLQAVLYDGSRSMQLARTPVVVSGVSGSGDFRIDRPVVGFTEGSYHLDILFKDGKLIATRAFRIGR